MKHITRENLNKIIELRHLLHSRPELSLQESGTNTILKDFLHEHTTLEVIDRDGLQTAHEIHEPFPETRNHDGALDRVIRAAAGLQLPVMEMKDLWRASEDFGHYLKVCPGAMFYIGNGEDHPAVHTDRYDFNDKILSTAVDLFLALTEPE